MRKLKVLYVTFHPNALSESYIRSEIEWMQAHEVEVAMLAHAAHEVTYPNPVCQVQVGGSLQSAIERFAPDVLHFEWLYVVTWLHERELRAGVPLPATVRGHSFDFTPQRALDVAALESVQRVWLFPHFAAQVQHPKVAALASCFPAAFQPGVLPERSHVIRTTAGVPHKRLEQWLDIAAACPEVRFTLVMTRALPPHEGYPESLARALPRNVSLQLNLQREQLVPLMQTASIYLTTGARHSFGMPVSVAEALACGQLVLLPDVPGAHAYAGAAGRYFKTQREACELIRNAVRWSESTWWEARRASLDQSALYTADRILPAILAEWRALAAQKSPCTLSTEREPTAPLRTQVPEYTRDQLRAGKAAS